MPAFGNMEIWTEYGGFVICNRKTEKLRNWGAVELRSRELAEAVNKKQENKQKGQVRQNGHCSKALSAP